jgi:ribosomal protein S18 acetylase RimI-like enzyme
MYTDPAARGQGFANAILAQLHHWATSRGATDAFLNVLATNEAALSVYRAHGYEHVYDYRYVTVS